MAYTHHVLFWPAQEYGLADPLSFRAGPNRVFSVQFSNRTQNVSDRVLEWYVTPP